MTRSAVGQRVADAHLAFALSLHRAIAPDPNVAACLSPYSVASALGLAASGARGDTRAELTSVLLGDPDGSLTEHGAVLAEAASLAADGRGEPPTLGVSNTLWAAEGLAVHRKYTEDVLAWPGGAVRQAPFHSDPDGSRNMINSAVSDTTRRLIRELIPNGAIDRSTVATLVNALYLKTSWRNSFPEPATDSRPFHTPGGTRSAPTMRLVKRLDYAAVDGWRVVVLPAAGGVDAVVLLPDAPLADAEPALTGPRLSALLAAPQQTEVELYLPKFRVTGKVPLRPVLENLGAPTMFTPRADFTGISAEPIAVSSVWHQAVLTVDEHGLEGAAATALVMVAMAMARRPEPVVLRIDRPFLVLVRHRASGGGYFLSRVVEPG
ncbi:MAG TPA: serpin family protein [Pseudonocardiaceae bacterium]|jgi:serpin B|nr:serpin family protein [Pseudonocardiaceae bacterium]